MLLLSASLYAQVDISYQTPPKEIMDLADAQLAPSMRIDDAGKRMVLLGRNQYKTLAELSETEMRLGGLRINPVTNIGSRERYKNNIWVMRVGEQKETQVTGLPDAPRLSNFSWSPDDKYMAFTHTTSKGVELWLLDVDNAKAKKLTEANLNANMGRPFAWFKSSDKLLVQMLPDDRKALIDKTKTVPTGPRISVNEGQQAQNRTYQDLLADKVDEANFEQLVRSSLMTIDLNGKKQNWKESAMYRRMSFSPDGQYILVSEINRPFSYLVPYHRFPTTYKVYTKEGKYVKTIEEVSLIEELPKGFMSVRKGKRNIQWRSDEPATLVYSVALDGGDSGKKVENRDELFTWKAPFNDNPQSLVKTLNRYAGIIWGTKNMALVYDNWWNTRNMKAYLINPEDRTQKPKIIQDRNFQARYSDPGVPVTVNNKYGKSVMMVDGDYIYLLGDGYSKEGVLPFVDKFNIKTKETKRLWRAKANDKLESVLYALNMKKGKVLTSIESRNEYPNFYIRNIRKKDKTEQITFFENPFASMANVQKEVIKYKRADGVDLSATLYLPVDYDKNSGKKLPMIMWAYPAEFKDKASAGQVTASPNEFTYVWYGSPIFWVNRGYAILDDASFPIIGEGDVEPNDSFIKQLVANAKAAIDAVDKMGYIDRKKVAVGGHSYGAFMTANLLSHCDLFAAGIARSGAYNRTLTPFGFQSEERNYWEAPEIYYGMSPFMHADKMKSNLLLIHGEADNNSGTYPMQSKRYFNALKGLGANVRLVILPKESHGYRARASVLHVLWEQDQWLEKYLKNKK